MVLSQGSSDTNSWYITITTVLAIAFISGGVYKCSCYKSGYSFSTGVWYHVAFVRKGSSILCFVNGVSQTLTEDVPIGTNDVGDVAAALEVGRFGWTHANSYVNGNIDELRITKGYARWTSNFTPADNPSVSTQAWIDFQKILNVSINSRDFSSKTIVSTYSVVYTVGDGAYLGTVLAPNGDIHFVPSYANRGQKINCYTGIVSTYTLAYTTTGAYEGGVLAPNGDIHFIPVTAKVGQKINSSGIVSTYSLAYTTANAYVGGVVALNGDIHFVPYRAGIGQKVSASGVVSTYALIYTGSDYIGGVLAPNGDIHFIPCSAPVGQKVSNSGVVSTYSLVYTRDNAYVCGVIAPNGDIHFAPAKASVGQKVSTNGVVSTYSLVYTNGYYAYYGGVLAPNGDIHFVPSTATVGQKINTATGVVSTYALAYTTTWNHAGGTLAPNGEIHLGLNGTGGVALIGQKITILTGIPLDPVVCQSPFLNKF